MWFDLKPPPPFGWKTLFNAFGCWKSGGLDSDGGGGGGCVWVGGCG